LDCIIVLIENEMTLREQISLLSDL